MALEFNFNNSQLFIDVDSNNSSKFDELLSKQSREAMDSGLFRYKLPSQLEWKRLPGKFNFLCQLTIDRAIRRRLPDKIESVNLPFDPEKFNFTKANPKEIMMTLCNEENDKEKSADIFINVSPMSHNHFLIVPQTKLLRPQVLTDDGFLFGLHFLCLSSDPYMSIGFNSLCAHASVNHQHLHAWKMPDFTYLESTKVCNVGNIDNFGQLLDGHVRLFLFTLNDLSQESINRVTKMVMFATELLRMNEVPYCLRICRGRASLQSKYDHIRIFLWPRLSTAEQNVGKISNSWNAAVCEMSGLVIIYDEKFYETVNEAILLKELNNCSIAPEQFEFFQKQFICEYSKIN